MYSCCEISIGVRRFWLLVCRLFVAVQTDTSHTSRSPFSPLLIDVRVFTQRWLITHCCLLARPVAIHRSNSYCSISNVHVHKSSDLQALLAVNSKSDTRLFEWQLRAFACCCAGAVTRKLRLEARGWRNYTTYPRVTNSLGVRLLHATSTSTSTCKFLSEQIRAENNVSLIDSSDII